MEKVVVGKLGSSRTDGSKLAVLWLCYGSLYKVLDCWTYWLVATAAAGHYGNKVSYAWQAFYQHYMWLKQHFLNNKWDFCVHA